MAPEYVFRPMTPSDLPLIRRWLAMPHVLQWWGDPDEQYVILSGDLDVPAMHQYIVSTAGTSLAYLQSYELSAWNVSFGAQPLGTRGIDLFIGEAEMVGRGHGSALIRRFVDDCFVSGTPRMVTDPDPVNKCAICAYQKAGFATDRIVVTPDGPASLMVRDR